MDRPTDDDVSYYVVSCKVKLYMILQYSIVNYNTFLGAVILIVHYTVYGQSILFDGMLRYLMLYI